MDTHQHQHQHHLPTSPPEIWHTTTGTPGSPTLLLLHGLFSSHLEFSALLPHLTPYYFILLVDLPGHSNSQSATLNTTTTYRFPEITSALATLIRTSSPSGTAHLAGLSYGGFLALSLARAHPELVASVFTSGSAPWAGIQRFVATRPRLLWCVIAPPILYVPDSLFAWLLKQMGLADLEAMREESKRNFSNELMRAGFEDCAGSGWRW
ncbi:hypothetical protein N0V83_004053 [Neocucurbitaria cava]|uniref:AB hydrolase-1 domain-containing protein n=1 Tax=Neocucurbitaria cava TaxID=798079 RepID=A0A9W9CNR3_9PLEO|nr:hypothetical protein N0V83_004053 [Neocucurbitaria cava]